MPRFPALLLLGLTFLIPNAGQASGHYSRPLRELVKLADDALAGTVDSTRTVRLPTVVTLVHLSRLQYAKGDSLPITLTLRMYGGIYEGWEYQLLGSPELEVGTRYVLLVRKDLGVEPYYMPIVSGQSGVYPVRMDSIAREPVVHDSQGRPVMAISEGHIVVLERGRSRPEGAHINPIPAAERTSEIRYGDEDDGERLTEEEFLSAIREFARAEATK